MFEKNEKFFSPILTVSYACTSIEDDKTILSNLLDWWSKDNYDYHNEWLFETAQALKNTDACLLVLFCVFSCIVLYNFVDVII